MSRISNEGITVSYMGAVGVSNSSNLKRSITYDVGKCSKVVVPKVQVPDGGEKREGHGKHSEPIESKGHPAPCYQLLIRGKSLRDSEPHYRALPGEIIPTS
jgi:hypothetical protein